jgi:hypothetical protein
MPVQLNRYNPNTKRNETIYFSDTFANQLVKDGYGFGTFQVNSTELVRNKPVSLEELDEMNDWGDEQSRQGKLLR